MALTATIRTFTIDLSDVDRGVYTQLELRVAQHPSESVPFMITRLMAYLFEYTEDLVFGRGVSNADEPAVYAKDPTGRWLLWIDVGAPGADRLHRASKRADRVVIYTHRDPDEVARRLAGETIHQVEALRIYGVPESLIEPLGAAVGRRNTWGVVRSGGEIYVSGDGVEAQGSLTERGV
ncbi:MAG: hypothetical protein ACI9U2_003610 [Bradymonadia bacterium]